MNNFSIEKFYAWAPGMEDDNDFLLWAKGQKTISKEKTTPDISHLPPIARRRLSQLTKMVLHVGHRLMEGNSIKTILCSQFGEITQQHHITQGILEKGEVRPSNFSLSVFNTPLSLLSIHENNQESNIVLLGGESGLVNGLTSALSRLKSPNCDSVLLLFADELLPDDYQSLDYSDSEPFAFGLVLNQDPLIGREIEYLISKSETNDPVHPLSLYRWLLSEKEESLVISDCGIELTLNANRNVLCS